MKNSQKGAVGASVVVSGVLIVIALLAGGYYITQRTSNNTGSGRVEEEEISSPTGVINQEETVVEEGAVMNRGEIMMEPEAMTGGEAVMQEEIGEQEETTSSYSGQVLAGSSAPLLVFNQADYDKAVAEGKLIVLYFYANWCPTCKAEFPSVQAAFDQLNSNKVVGFRVNFNDNETDTSEEALAREFGVPYQHTKVFVQNGNQLLKSPETWDAQRYVSEITSRI
jgi:thiol-disulfide isomerase/thioredoxin